jgi:DNA-binding helix-hairpin-helix protein with protein kinase domain
VRLKDEPFAKGGEGCIYDVGGDNELVAKIYHPAGRTSSRYEKIKVMLEHPPKETARSQTAWPVDVLYDTAGSFIGFLMPRIKKVTKIDILYSYDNRGRHPWGWYIQAAQNLCAAVCSVHQSGHCVGDLNPANICVEEATGLVTLVDTDSYHICAPGGRIYPCVVCMPAPMFPPSFTS